MPELDGHPVKRIDTSISVQELYGEVEQILAVIAPRPSA
jgi:hypothetical protein